MAQTAMTTDRAMNICALPARSAEAAKVVTEAVVARQLPAE
jgi:hypothetical protein